MTKTAFLKLCVAIVITFILTLPEHFKTPKGRILELTCLKLCLKPNLTHSLSSFNLPFMTFLKPVKEAQIILEVFLNHSDFENVTRTCQDITSKFQMCSLCLVCEPKGNVSSISQEETSTVLTMTGSVEMKDADFHSPCQHFNFTAAPTVEYWEEKNTTCNLKMRTRRSTAAKQDPAEQKPVNHTCRITESLNNCTHLSLYLEMDTNYTICSMKIIWYALVLLVFVALIILLTHKIREGHRVQKWQSHKYKPASVLLRERDSEKLRVLNVRVISETMQGHCSVQVKEILPSIPELEVATTAHLEDLNCT
ncbi:transmembrane protein 156 isoform X1 [Ochotona curzoniae]|uniref:transmembrane protein 156 isoform X1 n=1 Tax=Ochotona curzoniae TaxID=130825 RepID=UPI001B3477D1|nr:transmembrane protein 156 isoform X1 [Ochotona curzoniae]